MRTITFSAFLLIVTALIEIECQDRADPTWVNGGTCVYKIFEDYKVCLEAQQQRINRDYESIDHTNPIAQQQIDINRIGCCAYWEFLSCVEKVSEKCKEKYDVERYTEQLGSAVPLRICREHFPRHSDVCGRASHAIVVSSALFIIALIIALIK